MRTANVDDRVISERLDREDRLYDRVLALRSSLVATQKELDELAIKIRVAHLGLERARTSSAWRFAHGVIRLLRRVKSRGGSGTTDPFDAAMATLAALEQQSRGPATR